MRNIINLKRERDNAIILNLVRKFGPLSRSKIRSLTGIRLASVTEYVKGLIERGMIIETGRESSKSGRRRVSLELNKDFGYTVGLEFRADFISVCVVDFSGVQIYRQSKSKPLGHNKDRIVDSIKGELERAINYTSLERGKILGIGVADPGMVDREGGISLFSTIVEGWENVPLKQILMDAFDRPVSLEQAPMLKAVSEAFAGKGARHMNMIYVEYGEGLSCGVSLENNGRRIFMSGELGHNRVSDSERTCNCGSFGCLEAIASMPALARRVTEAIDLGAFSIMPRLSRIRGTELTGEIVFEAARKEDKLAVRIVDSAFEHIGVGIANAVNLINPDVVVLDQTFSLGGDHALSLLERTIKRESIRNIAAKLKIFISDLGEDIGALGGALFVLESHFEIPTLPTPECLTAS